RSLAGPALAAHAELRAVAFDTVANPGRPAAGVADQHHVRDVDVQLGVDDPALLELGTARRTLARGALVLLGHRRTLDHHAPVARKHADHATGVAGALAGHDLHGVVLVDVHAWHVTTPPGRAR